MVVCDFDNLSTNLQGNNLTLNMNIDVDHVVHTDYTGIGPPASPVHFEYDAVDNLTVVHGPDAAHGWANVHTDISYDALGRKTSMTDPDMGAWSYAYDAVGNLIKQVDAKSQRICFYYDELNRLKGKTYHTGTDDCAPDPGYGGYEAKYYYDGDSPGDQGAPQPQGQAKGKRTAMLWALYDWTVYHYDDDLGRLNQEQTRIDGTWYTTGYEYDAANRMTEMTYPDAGSEPVAYTYNAQGLLDSVVGTQPYVEGSSYDEAGRLTARRQENNANEWTTVYTYHPWNNPNLGRLSTITASAIISPSTTAEPIQDLSYAYDPVGNVAAIEDLVSGQTQGFSYDALDRLINASASAGDGNGVYEEDYMYYRGGSFQRKGLPNNATDGLYDYGDDEHNHAVTSYRDNSYGYDANGSMITRTVSSTAYFLAYDGENRLIGVEGGGPAVSFTYDGDGNRVRKEEGGVVTHYPGRHYESTVGSGSTKYYYAGSQLAAFERSPGYGNYYGLRFVFRDHLGSTSLIVNGGGVELWEDRYLP